MSEVTAEELQNLEQERDAAYDKYLAAVKEFTIKRLSATMEAAEISVEIQANSDTRIPFVVITIFDEDLFVGGVSQVRINAHEFLQCQASALADATGKLGLRRGRGFLRSDDVFSSSVLDRVENAVVQAMLRDFSLRLKKNPTKSWLTAMKKVVDAALVEGVQKS